MSGANKSAQIIKISQFIDTLLIAFTKFAKNLALINNKYGIIEPYNLTQNRKLILSLKGTILTFRIRKTKSDPQLYDLAYY